MLVKQKEHIKKNKFGQYFTPEIIADFMISIADISTSSKILEPSCGEGVFLKLLQEKGFTNLTAFEIDKNLASEFHFVRYESFISAKIEEKYDLIIGNPPYIRWKNLEEELKSELLSNQLWNQYFNSLCDYLYIFILKSIQLLDKGGQLIFICPEYWMNTTHSITLRNFMIENGSFEQIYHFKETPIFDKVNVSTVIFKYVKGDFRRNDIKGAKYDSNKKISEEILFKLKNRISSEDIEFMEIPHFNSNNRWLLYDRKHIDHLEKLEMSCYKQVENSILNLFENKKEFHTIGDICDIGNGLVSGLDKAFQVNGHQLNNKEKQATIDVIKAKNLAPFVTENITKYIFIQEGLDEKTFKEEYPNYFLHFSKYKTDLEKRYQYNRKINYWEWVFLRNFNLFSKKEKRIFVPSKERISNKNYFRFAMVNEKTFPTQDVTAIFRKSKTKESLEYILAYLNQPIIFEWLKSNGIVKGNIVEFSEKPIASIPFKKIDWKNDSEVDLHNNITVLTKKYLQDKDDSLLHNIEHLFKKLLKL